jgi:hypothetical protein
VGSNPTLSFLLLDTLYFEKATIMRNHKHTNLKEYRLLTSCLKRLLNPIAYVAYVSLVSITLLIFFSPIFSIILLVVSSFWFLYVKHYKSIYKIWLITLTIWYLIFAITLAEIQILIGFDHTSYVVIYLMDNDVLFPNLCYQTVCILDTLSGELGFPIYIPGFSSLSF